MTERLYYADSYCARFSARVIERLTWQDHPAVVLDQTAFYPASGGQPADRGLLGEIPVLNVVVRERDGAILHILANDLAGLSEIKGAKIEGELDWPRRFDHMQQHTGQHVLSAAFGQLLDADTVGFHMGAESSTVDVDAAYLELKAVAPVEQLANRVVWENREIGVSFVTPDDLAALSLRRLPAMEDPVRIVEISGPAMNPNASFDLNPCGGTHVARTGEIGQIKIVNLNHRGDETRIEFLCGRRSLRDYRIKNTMVNQLTRMLTVGHWELDKAVERLQDEAKHLRRDLRRARERLRKMEAAELAETAVLQGPYPVVWRIWEQPGKPPAELRALALELAQSFEANSLLASIGQRVHLCFACADESGLDAAALLRETCALLGGKGGGSSYLAQGSAPAIESSRVEAVISDLLSNLMIES